MLRILIKIFTLITNALIASRQIFLASLNLRYQMDKIDIRNESKVIILGNGPSAKKDIISNFKFFKDNFIVVVNDFFFDSNFTLLKPQLYLIADPAYWQNDTTAENIEIRTQLITFLVDSVKWPMLFFIPLEAFKSNYFQKAFEKNGNIHVRFYHRNYIEHASKKIKFFFYNLRLASPRSGNVVAAAISLMLSNCSNDIFLFGVDHSWCKNIFVDELNRTCIINKHHYDLESSQPKVWLTSHNKPFRIFEALKAIANMLECYNHINEYAEYKNIKVLNFTRDSFIDSFKKSNEFC
jgi:hypothetical protein